MWGTPRVKRGLKGLRWVEGKIPVVGFERWGSAIICYNAQHKAEKGTSCAFAVFAFPFREICAVMAMGVARQREGERLKFEL